MISLFNNPNKRNYTAVFVDYEHWFYSMKHDYHTKPEVTEWMAEIGKDYDVKHWLAFADFNYEEIGREMQILQTAGFQVINSCHNFTYHKKGQTEFALLNQLYQYAINYPEVKTYILFTGNGDFESAVRFLREKMDKTVIVWAVRNAFSDRLRGAANETREFPSQSRMDIMYPLIVENLTYVKSHPHIVPTFRGTVQAISQKYGIPAKLIHTTLSEMISKGLVIQKEQTSPDGRTARIISGNWKELSKEGLVE